MTIDRVRSNTEAEINEDIDLKSEALIHVYTNQENWKISERIEELEGEWDVERWLETNASVLAFAGLMFGATYKKRWLVLPGVVLPFLFQHAVQGWCSPIAFFRKLGVRTRKEIEREKYALKILRGDFEDIRNMDRKEAALHIFRSSSLDGAEKKQA
ncbi:MAG: hypothetical protein WD037_06355 [Balneolales bacterium]